MDTLTVTITKNVTEGGDITYTLSDDADSLSTDLLPREQVGPAIDELLKAQEEAAAV